MCRLGGRFNLVVAVSAYMYNDNNTWEHSANTIAIVKATLSLDSILEFILRTPYKSDQRVLKAGLGVISTIVAAKADSNDMADGDFLNKASFLECNYISRLC
jgi:hypothetical protein